MVPEVLHLSSVTTTLKPPKVVACSISLNLLACSVVLLPARTQVTVAVFSANPQTTTPVPSNSRRITWAQVEACSEARQVLAAYLPVLPSSPSNNLREMLGDNRHRAPILSSEGLESNRIQLEPLTTIPSLLRYSVKRNLKSKR